MLGSIGRRGLWVLLIALVGVGPVWAQETPTEPAPVPQETELYPPFDDGLPQQTFDYVELLSLAANNNTELNALRDSWEIALATLPQIEGLPDPVLTAQYAQIPGFANPQFIHRGYVQVGVTQKLNGYGKVPAREAVAELEVKVRHKLYEERLNGLFTEIQKNLVELYNVESQIQIKRKHQFMIDHLIRVANVKYSVGKGAQPDVVMAQTERTKFESELSELWGQRKKILLSLRYLTGSDELPEGRAPVPDWPHEVELTKENLLKTAEQYRPQLWALRAQIEKAEARIRLAETEDNPDITLALMSRWFQYQPDGLMLTVSVPLPFFNKQRYHSAVVEKEREKEKAQALLEEAREKIELGLGRQLVEVETALDQYEITENTLLVQARQLFRGSLKSYETGGYDFSSLILAQHTLLNIELALVKYRTRSSLAVAEIEGLTGLRMVATYPLPKEGLN